MESICVIFTDLDGTLLDHDTYSFAAAAPALRLLSLKRCPLVICTSKTRAEIEVVRDKLGVADPFISENGGAVFIPRGYFTVPVGRTRETGDYLAIELGAPYDNLRAAIRDIRSKTGCKVVGFGDMSVEEVARDAGLDHASARLARMREYDEPFVVPDPACVDRVLAEIEARGFRHTRGGRYFHLTGDSDKGRAVSLLAALFREEYGTVTTVGLGDSRNDLPMLAAMDIPILVQKSDGSYEKTGPEVVHANGVGPEGWNRAVVKILKKI
ncbi:mannosyl-3-phosphoglycerate phosphatase [Methanofollis ethanolicus]|uniref:mannosyl-3-phosphoglycerate phosphatase n=1 Tax=Methanofollis ethanolicus TaxID=488124 RepID=UPI00082C523F|nr:mannosyl-3-phosphoglycerate phosphatase [Methanofollis ethanolicus]